MTHSAFTFAVLCQQQMTAWTVTDNMHHFVTVCHKLDSVLKRCEVYQPITSCIDSRKVLTDRKVSDMAFLQIFDAHLYNQAICSIIL